MINALPPLKWTASPNYSARGGQKVRLIVAHDCEGNYGGSVSWFAMARSQVSAHIVLRDDGGEATQMVAWANKGWHACNFNPFSEGVEAAGFAAKGFAAVEWDALAAIIAYRLRANGLPCQYASASNNWTGYCQHVDLGAAGGGHHDLTIDPTIRAAFIKRVETAYTLPQPTSWSSATTPPPIMPVTYTPNPVPRNDLVAGGFEWAQAQLNKLGFARPLLTVDGLDGPATERAVSAFQSAHGLHVDGIIGTSTTAELSKY